MPSSRPSAIGRSVPRTRPPGRRSSMPARDADLAEPAHRRDRGRHARGDRSRCASSATARPAGWASPIAEAALDRGARGDGHRRRTSRSPCPPAPRSSGSSRRPTCAPRCCGRRHAPDGAAGFDALIMAAAVADFRPTAPRRSASSSVASGLHAASSSRHRTSSPRSGGSPTGSTARGRPTPGAASPASRSSSGSPPRPARSTGPRRSSAQGRRPPRRQRRRGGRARGSAPRRTGSSILAADGSRDDLPLLSKRDVADRLLDRVARALDERDAAIQTVRTDRTEPGASMSATTRDPPPPDRRRHREAVRRWRRGSRCSPPTTTRRRSSSTRPGSRSCSSATRSAR